MIKARMVPVVLGIIVLLFFFYCNWNSKDIMMRFNAISENKSDEVEVGFKANFLKLPFGLIYIDGVLNYKDTIYKSSKKLLLNKYDILNELSYEIYFSKLVTDHVENTVTLTIPRKSLNGDIGQVFLYHNEIVLSSGKTRGVHFDCVVEELSIQ